MFNLGIFKQQQLKSGKMKGSIQGGKTIALDLYTSLDDLPEIEIDKLQERMLYRFRLQNSTLKCTHAHRFDDFDSLTLSTIATNFQSEQRLRVHDIGASDGRTSCDLYNRLNNLHGERLEFLASDYAPYLYVLKRARSKRRMIVDDQQHVLQIITPPFVFIVFHAKGVEFTPLNRFIRSLVSGLYAQPLLRDRQAGCPDIRRTTLALLCRECLANLRSKSNFRFNAYDVLSGPTDEFDIIRAMNVLNFTYFTKAQLKKALENISQSLLEGGLFVTGSNNEAGTIVDGGIYKKTENRLEKIAISGEGSKVDALISEWNLTAAAQTPVMSITDPILHNLRRTTLVDLSSA
jgi:chemotaxis methyl-accepting protein methylase